MQFKLADKFWDSASLQYADKGFERWNLILKVSSNSQIGTGELGIV